jgi:hypothetical protein
MKCSDIKELLSAYAGDELPRTQKEFVEEHLAGCADCRATLEEYREVRRHLMSLRSTPFISDIKGVTMSKIRGENTGKSARRWLRPALAAIPIVAILIALSILQPWSPHSGPQAIMAKAYAATSEAQSYSLIVSGTRTSGGKTISESMETLFSSPDRYHFKLIQEGQTEEIIIIGDKQYVKDSDMSRNMMRAMTASVSSFHNTETTLGLMDVLTNLQKLSDEKIDGTPCLHYKGRVDIEKQIADARRSMQESRERMGSDRPTDEEIDEMSESMRSINIEVELWIGKSDYLVRQWKNDQQRLDDNGELIASSTLYKFHNFNQPVTIEPPLDAQGNLLPDWQLAGTISPGSSNPVFTYGVTSSIGAQPGYDDAAHQQISYHITITNQSSETVRHVRVTLSTLATNEEVKPAIIEAEPENPGHQDFAPDESETYHAVWNYDGSDQPKEKIISLVDRTTITVKFTTEDGRELTQMIHPHAPYPTKTPPSEPPE